MNRPVRSVLQSVRILLTGLIDYAGLFPPAELDMKSAVRNYASYREGDHAWALGRFIAPISRLEEVEHAARDFFHDSAAPWRLSILCSPEPEAVRKILDFNQRHSGPADAVIDTIEMNIPETGEDRPGAESSSRRNRGLFRAAGRYGSERWSREDQDRGRAGQGSSRRHPRGLDPGACGPGSLHRDLCCGECSVQGDRRTPPCPSVRSQVDL